MHGKVGEFPFQIRGEYLCTEKMVVFFILKEAYDVSFAT